MSASSLAEATQRGAGAQKKAAPGPSVLDRGEAPAGSNDVAQEAHWVVIALLQRNPGHERNGRRGESLVRGLVMACVARSASHSSTAVVLPNPAGVETA